jgi:uncharacterized protein (TIGR02145 family)
MRGYATNGAGIGYGSAVSYTTQHTVTDYDDNVYGTVTIGTQVWMLANLKVTHYRNGNPIPNVTDYTTWSNLTTGACCDYDNTSSNSTKYGKLYNWYAVNDSRQIAPTGWHVATDAEWTTLTNYLGGENVVGAKLKEADTPHWINPNSGINESGFTSLPGGYCNEAGVFFLIGTSGRWWTTAQSSSSNAWYRYVTNIWNNLLRYDISKKPGFSVRFIKD